MNNELEKIYNLIELLTIDEDLKQDLWVKYLSGCPSHCLPDTLCDLIRDGISSNRCYNEYWNDVESLVLFCSQIKDLPRHQQNIMLLLYTGFTVELISEHKGISLVRIQQAVSSFYQRKVNNTP
jgi:hypothetical protein